MSVDTPAPIVEAAGIVKRFGPVQALAGVDFALRPGEVHALVGENGAGKTTLMSILYGLVQPDAGVIRVEGRPERFAACADAMRRGIGMVFQHFLLVDRFNVAQNVLLGREPTVGGFLDDTAAQAAVGDLVLRYGFSLDPRTPVDELGVGTRQQVELLRVLGRDARVVILDEPTASLSPAETASLFHVVERLRADGRAIAFVSHKLREVLAIADRITVMRSGAVVGTLRAAEADESTLAEMIVGRGVDLSARVQRSTTIGAVALDVHKLTCRRDNGAPAIRDIDLSIRAGEIVGIAGVEGNGQLEFAECLYGLRAAAAGVIRLKGVDVTQMPSRARRARGMRYIPADRVREGLVLEFDATENVLLGDQRRAPMPPLLDLAGGRDRAQAIVQEYALDNLDLGAPASAASGGMQQKLIAGRELYAAPAAVIAYTPTRGVDVGAAQLIYERLRSIRDAGAALVLISHDLDELRALSDRIVVFANGSVAGELRPEDAGDAALGRLMGGVTSDA